MPRSVHMSVLHQHYFYVWQVFVIVFTVNCLGQLGKCSASDRIGRCAMPVLVLLHGWSSFLTRQPVFELPELVETVCPNL